MACLLDIICFVCCCSCALETHAEYIVASTRNTHLKNPIILARMKTGGRRVREGDRRKGLRTGSFVFHGGRLQAHRRGWQGQLRPAVEHSALKKVS